jgi:hypothetical protein
MPRRSIMAAIASALRWMLGRSLATLGIASSIENSIDDGVLLLHAPFPGSHRRRIVLRKTS